jgi:hypothetical protein
MTASRGALLCALFLPSVAHAVGFAHSDNFAVFSPDQGSRAEEQQFAKRVLENAEAYRQEIAQEWLGEQLANGEGESVIYVKFSPEIDRGRTWAVDCPGREFHNVYLHTTAENATGSTLRHEITHTVLATAFPHPQRLPIWVEEGIASRYDDEGRKDAREQQRMAWVRAGRLPKLQMLLELSNLGAFDDEAYTTSTSLVAYLLTRGDAPAVLRFARDGQAFGWDAALASHYGIGSVAELQAGWEQWLAANPGE